MVNDVTSERGRLRDGRTAVLAACTAALLLAAPAPAPANQGRSRPAEDVRNPYQPTGDVIREGMAAFRANCAYCHGIDAKGARGPDLTNVFASTAGRTDEGLFHLIRRGIPGTEMPPAGVFLQEPETWKTILYLRTLAAPAPAEPPRGNAENGEKIFRARCSSCHRVNGRGGVLGPDLSRIGVARTRQALVRQIRGAVEDIRPGYEPVTVVTREGRSVRGTRKGEDLFSVQMMDASERLQGFVKADVKSVTEEERSLMPAYGVDQLSESDLDDLLRYLGTLRGSQPAGRE
jgi:putative heme-binding domain-containing protein